MLKKKMDIANKGFELLRVNYGFGTNRRFDFI